ncbi:MBL fold metallo-hydrolase [Candidatus Micrarchaeota archaeon]|nr:MBL fold metallo-hydrolase [Candidatus Micrarchaeota archaeon]
MDIKLHCFGASNEVGRSAFILKTDKSVLIDYGIKLFGKDGKPEYPLDLDQRIDAALLSHAHLDHSGFIPNLYKFSKVRWYATPPTRELCELLWKDSMKIMGDELPYRINHFNRALKYWTPVMYGQNMRMGQTDFRFLDAGHIAGSMMIEAQFNRKKIIYTGDFKMEETRLHKGARPIEDANAVIIDSTYAKKEHPSRKEAEKKIADEISETLKAGGSILFPAFSLGRTQELIRIVRAYHKDVDIFVDGMGRAMCEIYMKYPRYIKEPNEFRAAVRSSYFVRGPNDRKKATRDPAVIISSAGMMEGGPVLGYLMNLNSQSRIVFTGYVVEGTNGWKLQNEGYVTIEGQDMDVDLPIENVDLSAHAGRSDILNFIKWANPDKVVIVHSDAAKDFERELKEDFGYDAVAPEIGDTINL